MNAVDYVIVKAAREGLTLLGVFDDGRVVSPADDLSEDGLIALNTRDGLRQKTAVPAPFSSGINYVPNRELSL